MEFLDIAKAAAGRWRERRRARESALAKIDSGKAIEAENVERLQARFRLQREASDIVNREQSRIATAAAAGKVRPLTEAIGLERVIGKRISSMRISWKSAWRWRASSGASISVPAVAARSAMAPVSWYRRGCC